jgi:hypothetical protein
VSKFEGKNRSSVCVWGGAKLKYDCQFDCQWRLSVAFIRFLEYSGGDPNAGQHPHLPVRDPTIISRSFQKMQIIEYERTI